MDLTPFRFQKWTSQACVFKTLLVRTIWIFRAYCTLTYLLISGRTVCYKCDGIPRVSAIGLDFHRLLDLSQQCYKCGSDL